MVLWAGFALGLAARIALLWTDGTEDLAIFVDWGANVRRDGLAGAYAVPAVDYFPFIMQLLGGVSWLAVKLSLDPMVAVKLSVLLAEVLTFGGLLIALRHWSRDPRWALIYWVHPYFIVTFGLGYVDAYLGLMVVLSVLAWALVGGRRGAALAGIPLAMAFTMKPQGLVLLAMVGIAWGAAALRRDREAVLRWTLVGGSSVLALAAYYVYFATTEGSYRSLPEIYLFASRSMPSLTAQMPNVWTPLATLLSDGRPNFEVYTSDNVQRLALGFTVLVLALLGWLVTAWLRRDRERVAVLLLLTIGATVVPMIGTAAHENHFFLGGVLCTLIAALVGTRRFGWLFAAFLAVQTVNLFGLYGFGANSVYDGSYTTWDGGFWPLAAAVVSVALFVPVLTGILSVARPGLRLRGLRPTEGEAKSGMFVHVDNGTSGSRS
jgi:hypothetical protein